MKTDQYYYLLVKNVILVQLGLCGQVHYFHKAGKRGVTETEHQEDMFSCMIALKDEYRK